MNKFTLTTGKVYDKKAYTCNACENRYYENDSKKCPFCGSKERRVFHLVTSKINETRR